MAVEEEAAPTKYQNFEAETDEERVGKAVEISSQYYEKYEPPDGGRAWLIAVGAMFSHFATWGTNASYGVFLSFYISHNTFVDATDNDFALIGSIVVFLGQFLAPWASIAANLFGTKTVIGIGVILQTAGFLLASFVTKLWQLYLTQGLLVGISFSLIFIPASLTIPTWFLKRRATAMGITVSGGGFGGLIFSLSVNKMLGDMNDQKWALRMICFVTLFAGLIVFIVVEPYKPLSKKYDDSNKKEQFRKSLTLIFDKDVFKSIYMGVFSLWYSICQLGYILMLFTVSPYANLVGLSSQQGAVLTALLNTGQLIGRPFLGYLADRFGHCNIAAIINLIIAIMLLAFWINADTYGSLIAFVLVLGAIIGVGIVMGQPLAADIVEDSYKIPAAWSTVNILALFLCLVAEIIALSMRDKSSRRPYLPTQIFSGACFFACFVLLLVIREFLIRKSLKIEYGELHLYLDNLGSEANVVKGKPNYEDYKNVSKNELASKLNSYEHILKPSITCYIWRIFYFRKV